MFDITTCHPLSPALSPTRIQNGSDNALSLLKKAWDKKVRRFGRVLHESVTSVKLFPMPLPSLGR